MPTIADGEMLADVGFARADVDDVAIGGCDADRAEKRDAQLVSSSNQCSVTISIPASPAATSRIIGDRVSPGATAFGGT